ncbi:fasciclin-like arabinogalactan protein 14 [Arachis duranensis]|uniref:Fasciclin-like arabinogalactan protein 14 n=1 Tax=Arachis duranensis TaxID=130453 RepID=A0A9C6U052_ARADU|nr:fasciclin-like arabinogalactan protein 14 [Arachis duranensis]
MSFKSSLFPHLALFILYFSATHAFDIAQMLSQYPEFSSFKKFLTDTKIVDQINSRKSVTVMVMDNAAMSAVAGKSPDIIKAILMTHVILDYYDERKLMLAQGSNVLLTTLYQTTGLAVNNQGFIKVALVGEGEIAFGCAAPGSPLDVKLVQTVTTQPYDVSILQVTKPIIWRGQDAAKPASSSAVKPASSQGASSPIPSQGANAPKGAAASGTTKPIPPQAATPAAAAGTKPVPSSTGHGANASSSANGTAVNPVPSTANSSTSAAPTKSGGNAPSPAQGRGGNAPSPAQGRSSSTSPPSSSPGASSPSGAGGGGGSSGLSPSPGSASSIAPTPVAVSPSGDTINPAAPNAGPTSNAGAPDSSGISPGPAIDGPTAISPSDAAADAPPSFGSSSRTKISLFGAVITGFASLFVVL